jgi:hypothetical protein
MDGTDVKIAQACSLPADLSAAAGLRRNGSTELAEVSPKSFWRRRVPARLLMIGKHKASLCLFIVFFAAATMSRVWAQLDPCIEAYGGKSVWDDQGTVSYDVDFNFGDDKLQDHQLFDLKSRDGLIKGEKYKLGSQGEKVWIKPDAKALGKLPPRFYLRTPFYFFAMPFVFADAGAIATPADPQTFDGRSYDTVKVTYKPGTGDSPKDYYILYIDSDTKRLKLVRYVVTYFAEREGKPMENLEEHAIVFDAVQRAGDLWVPKETSFYKWEDGKLGTEKLGSISYSNVKFSSERPDPNQFKQPSDAVPVD